MSNSVRNHPQRHISETVPNDIIYFRRKDLHAYISETDNYEQTGLLSLTWLDGYEQYQEETIHKETLDGFADRGKIRCSTTNVPSIEQYEHIGIRNPEETQRDSTLTPGPRLPTDKLRFKRIYSRNRINGFLKHPLVDHKHGRVQKAKAMFVAERPDGKIAAALTLNSPNARLAFDRHTVEITRYASHPETRPYNSHETNNTATWMIAKACQWAALEGYETMTSLAGTDDNGGAIYKAADFRITNRSTSDGKHDRDGRTNHSHATELIKFERTLSVDGKNSPEAPISRRVEGRLETDNAKLDFTQYNTSPRTPIHYNFTREDVTDTKYATDNNINPFSKKLYELIEHTDILTEDELSKLATNRTRNRPAAAFGALHNRDLVATLIITEDPNKTGTVKITSYITHETKYPDRTAQWLLTRARKWAFLDGYSQIKTSQNLFDDYPNISNKVPKSVGFAKNETTNEYTISNN